MKTFISYAVLAVTLYYGYVAVSDLQAYVGATMQNVIDALGV